MAYRPQKRPPAGGDGFNGPEAHTESAVRLVLRGPAGATKSLASGTAIVAVRVFFVRIRRKGTWVGYNAGMPAAKFRLLFAIPLLFVSMAVLAWGIWPNPKTSQVLQVPGSEMGMLLSEAVARADIPLPVYPAEKPTRHLAETGSLLISPEARQLRFEWPALSRVGDIAEITLKFEPDATQEDRQAAAGGDAFPPGVFYGSHNVMAEARLEMAGQKITPVDIISQPVLPGKEVKSSWNFVPGMAGTYEGVIWFYVRIIPHDGGVASQLALSAKPMTTRAASLLGLSGPNARLFGSAGILGAFLLVLDPVVVGIFRRLARSFS